MDSTVRLAEPASPPRRVLPRVSRDRGRTVIWLDGEHDIAAVPVLADWLARAIAADDCDVTVDLGGVTFISAATIAVMVRARDYLLLDSRSLTLRSPPRCARRVLETCGLTGLVEQLPPEGAPSALQSSSVGGMGS